MGNISAISHSDSCNIYNIYSTYYLSQRECDMAEILKPESEISSHITLTSVISGLFHTRYLY